MTWTYVVADKMDEIFEEIVEDALKNLKKMHLGIYENIAWYYLKKDQIDEAIRYLKISKKKIGKVEDIKYFKALADHPEFKKLME